MRALSFLHGWRGGLLLLCAAVLPLSGGLPDAGAHFVLTLPEHASFTQEIDDEAACVRLMFPGLTVADFNDAEVHHTVADSCALTFSVEGYGDGQVFVLDVSGIQTPVITLSRLARPSQLLIGVYDKPALLWQDPVRDYASLKKG